MFDNAIKPMEHAKKMAERMPKKLGWAGDDFMASEDIRTAYIQAIRDAHADPTPFGLALHSTYQTEKMEKEWRDKLLEAEKKRSAALVEVLENIGKLTTGKNDNWKEIWGIVHKVLNQYNQ